MKICSKSKLKEEINRIKKILLDNGYPEAFVIKQISKKIAQFSTPKRFGPDKRPVYFRVSYTGKTSLTVEKNVRTAVENCYGSVTVRTVFVSRHMLPASRKDVLPAHQKSSVVCEYKCHCDSRYVGRTYQRLQDRIKQHAPKWLRQHTGSQPIQPDRACKKKQFIPKCGSAIGQHLLRERPPTTTNTNFPSWTLREVVFILFCSKPATSRVRRPNLCKEKEFVYTLSLFKYTSGGRDVSN